MDRGDVFIDKTGRIYTTRRRTDQSVTEDKKVEIKSDPETKQEIHLARHAQSLFNAGLSKEPDCGLTDLGKQQANKLEGEYDIVICSNLLRSFLTLHHSRVKFHSLLKLDLCREMKNATCDFLKHEPQIQETEHEVMKRVGEFKTYLKNLSTTHKRILVISHSTFLHRMIGKHLGNCEKVGYVI